MITVEQYVGRWASSPDWTPARMINAGKLLIAVNAIMAEMALAGVAFKENPATGSQVSGQTYGGFRPQNCPQGAPRSSHKEALACDIYDPAGDIDAHLLKHPDLLIKYGIYIEDPAATVHWSHWSIKPPRSGKHIFTP
jgi:hypothetical protein